MKTLEERALDYAKKSGIDPNKDYFDFCQQDYIAGATEQKVIDEQVRLKKCDDMTEAEYNHETAFVDWYLENGKGTPTYSDAIEWARKEVINEAFKWLKARNVLTDASLKGFRKTMEE